MKSSYIIPQSFDELFRDFIQRKGPYYQQIEQRNVLLKGVLYSRRYHNVVQPNKPIMQFILTLLSRRTINGLVTQSTSEGNQSTIRATLNQKPSIILHTTISVVQIKQLRGGCLHHQVVRTCPTC